MQRWLVCLVLLLALAVPGFADTVLVLPFFNDSAVPDVDWISESISFTVSEALASRGLLLLEREGREEVYRRLSIRTQAHLTHASVIKVSEGLDASQAVYGDFEVAGTAPGARALRISATVIDMKRMRKSEQFVEAGSLEDLAELQTHLAWQVLRYLAPDFTPAADVFLAERPPVRLDAMENYTRGLLATNYDQKHRFFTQAVRLDGRFQQPNFELGRLYWERKEYRLAADWLAKVRSNAPRYFESNFLLGLSLYSLGDYTGAQAALERVAAAVPLNEVYNNLGAAFSRRNLPQALESFEKAIEGDPADPDYQFNAGYVLWKMGEFDRAAERFRAVLERNPEDPQATMMLGRALARTAARADSRNEGLERLKLNYDEGGYWQLKAALENVKSK